MSQEIENNVLDLVKHQGFYLYEQMNDFEKFKEELPSKEMFYSSLADIKISDKEHDHFLNVWDKFEMKTTKDYQDCYLKYDVFIIIWCVWKI